MYLSCICLLALHTLVCVIFSLPPGVGGWLRLLLEALPGLFCLPFYPELSVRQLRITMVLLAFLDFHQPHVVAIQETKIDSSIATSELFPETCPYSVYRKDRNIHGGGVMLLVHKDISHMPITELENDSESIWVKVFANKTSHFVASWYRLRK